jgi:hypothetical protein
MSFFSTYNPPPVQTPPPPNLTGINTPTPPAGFGESPIGTKPMAKNSQPTFLGAGLAPSGGQTGSPSLIGGSGGGGYSPTAAPAQVAAIGASQGRGRR